MLTCIQAWCYHAVKISFCGDSVLTIKEPLNSEVERLMELELKKQRENINLIAAENYASKAVLLAQGSVLTNKYAEGYPGNRYYAGCAYIDQIEQLAIDRAKKLFGAEHANVQPHSGSQANMATYFALIQPGDKVVSMLLNQGGHLTHGSSTNFSGKWYDFVFYGLNRETERIDYDQVEKLAMEHKPKVIVCGASSYPRTIDFTRFREIARKVNAYLVADIAHIAGLVATGLHPSPVGVADVTTSSTHKTLRGPRAGFILCNQDLAKKIDSAVFPATQGGPQMHAIAAKAIAFYEALQPEFKVYQQAVLDNARTLADELTASGFRLVTGGTDNHLMLVDLTNTDITGMIAQTALEESNILANKNAIPFDTRPPKITSGIRFGTPAVTSRGFGKNEIKQMAAMIIRVLAHPDDEKVKKQVKEEVIQLCLKFPAPGLD
jgi:glycine hydroxymethyltransferase